ncbi:ECF sigma factor [Anatilimnocola aggregata]|uniref:ECF sigma factor n=1 Tax=Anatilimnocola aggregata TaxID=2528021 RepID=A0A517YF56_9BACT|nr:ECF-type sigma factor [Anatilimnocola aggregata]QDU28867.1 ECF sigma factor [Anatilimnocola aggregata]
MFWLGNVWPRGPFHTMTSGQPTENSVTLWLQELQAGESVAAGRIWERYYERLVRLAAQKLRSAPRRMADEEDVVLNAFDSFYRGVNGGRFPQLDDRDDLWQVLVMLTARKAINQAKHDQRQKRGGGQIRGESVFIGANDEPMAGIDQVVGGEPTPEFAQQVGEDFEELLASLNDDMLRRIALAKLEGYTNDEIAAKFDVRTRTIERKLSLIRELWAQFENPSSLE